MTPQNTSAAPLWMRLKQMLRSNLSMTVIVAAAVLLELTSAVMYYTAQNIIQSTMESLVEREMDAIYLGILNKLTRVEVAIDNMAWMVGDELDKPDSMFELTRKVVENNPDILGSSISFVPNYYRQKGRLFEAYSSRRSDGTIETMQLASAEHDYTKSEFFTSPTRLGKQHWSEPYMDADGAKTTVATYAVPVRDKAGRIVALADADLSTEWLETMMNEHKTYESTVRFLVSAGGNLLAGRKGRIYDQTLKRLQANDDKKGYITMNDEDGNKLHVFFKPVGGRTNWRVIIVLNDSDVFGSLRHVRAFLLLLVMAGMVLIGFIVYRTSRNLERLRIAKAEQERIGSELMVARRIQQSMLPEARFQHKGLDICGSLMPAKEVGGDLFDYFLRDDKLYFCIGDVSGKGAAAAMLMAVVHTLFRSASAHQTNPAQIMHTINEALCEGNESNMFVTLFIGVLNLSTGHLCYSNAGHDAPIVAPILSTVSGKGAETSNLFALPVDANLPVGVFGDTKYTLQDIHILPNGDANGASQSPTTSHQPPIIAIGATIFLYTDGLTEAMNDRHQLFGAERSRHLLAECASLEPQAIVEQVTRAVHQFAGNARQSDDLTMLAIRFTTNRNENTFADRLVIKNKVSEVARLSSFMKDATGRLCIEQSAARELRLAVEEAVVNAIDYAYPTNGDGEIEISLTSDGKSMRVRIADRGVEFDPTTKKEADTTLSVEERQTGGLGILLMRKLMDSIDYERTDGKNILTLTKLIKP